MKTDLKQAICSLFEVHQDERDVKRIITPLEYPGSNERIVVRVRPLPNDEGYCIDENGEAALYASMNGGDLGNESITRWAEKLAKESPVLFGEDEIISVTTTNERFIAPFIFRVAEAAQQLHAIATARVARGENNFKERISDVIKAIVTKINLPYAKDVELPIAGGLKADHVIGETNPLIIITATSATRLLEAEVIYLQYRDEKKLGYIVAIAEDQASVGKSQFERANYYTYKTFAHNGAALGNFVEHMAKASIQ